MTPAFTDPAARRRWDAYFSEVDRLLSRADADVASLPDARQMKSIRILADVLQRPVPDGASISSFAGDVSVDVMDALAGRDFMRLEERVFAFANDLVARMKARLAK